MQKNEKSTVCVEIPCFLNADFAKTYTGRSLPSCGLMAGDLVCLRAASTVPDGGLAAVQDGEDTLLGRLFHINNGIALMPLDGACPARIFAEGQGDPPRIVGAVTGWVHSILPAESIQEGGPEL